MDKYCTKSLVQLKAILIFEYFLTLFGEPNLPEGNIVKRNCEVGLTISLTSAGAISLYGEVNSYRRRPGLFPMVRTWRPEQLQTQPAWRQMHRLADATLPALFCLRISAAMESRPAQTARRRSAQLGYVRLRSPPLSLLANVLAPRCPTARSMDCGERGTRGRSKRLGAAASTGVARPFRWKRSLAGADGGIAHAAKQPPRMSSE